MKRLLLALLCGALHPPPSALAQDHEAALRPCEKLAKSFDDEVKAHPGMDTRWQYDFFDKACLKYLGCPDFEKVRAMVVLMQPYYTERSDPGLNERLLDMLKSACHR